MKSWDENIVVLVLVEGLGRDPYSDVVVTSVVSLLVMAVFIVVFRENWGVVTFGRNFNFKGDIVVYNRAIFNVLK